uniref:CSON005216 protein n=1 Tax=Culicoides sonorensis TaxID=179676 RepID=A0A336K8P9_CULSO
MERKRSFKRRQPLTLAERAKDQCRKLTAFLFSNVGIILLVVLYTIAGSFMFIAIEGDEALERWQNVTRQRQGVVAKLWEITCCEINTFNKSQFTNLLVKLYWITVVSKEILKYQNSIVNAAKKGWQGGDTSPDGDISTPWTFSGAFLYSLTVITTIGYGNIAPRTELGKISTIFYAIIGMPLFLLYLSLIEEEISGDTHTVTVPLTVCITIMIGYIMFGATLFARWESWDLLDGSYFCFISLSSIGFGDMVPGLSLKKPENKDRLVEISFILCAVYLLLGMALIAIVMRATIQSGENGPKEEGRYIQSVTILIISYAGLGSVIFVSLDTKDDGIYIETSVAASKPRQADIEYSLVRTRTVDKLWSITEDLNILYKDNWTRLAAQEVKEFQEALLLEITKNQPQHTLSGTFSANKVENWTYSTAFLYSLTLISTIGYGNIVPPSDFMKMFALGYACVGIGIVLLYLSITGEVLSKWLRNMIIRTSKCFQKCSFEKNIKKPENNIITSIIISVLTLVLYIVFGTITMKFLQKPHWGTIDAFYFCFTTISTIGYGQLFPNNSVSQYACACYILIGMALVAMCFNLIQIDLMMWFKRIDQANVEYHDHITENDEQSANHTLKKESQYFISHCGSEFNLSGVGDLAIGTQKRKEKTVTFEDEALRNFSNRYTSDVFM